MNESTRILTTVSQLLEVKFLKASDTCSLVFVVLKSFEEVPSLFFTPSRRNPSVAVEDIVSRQTIYLYNRIVSWQFSN